MSETPTPATEGEPAAKPKRKFNRRFKHILTAAEQTVVALCETKGLTANEVLTNKAHKAAVVKAAMGSIRPEAVQERLEESALWLKAQLARMKTAE